MDFPRNVSRYQNAAPAAPVDRAISPNSCRAGPIPASGHGIDLIFLFKALGERSPFRLIFIIRITVFPLTLVVTHAQVARDGIPITSIGDAGPEAAPPRH